MYFELTILLLWIIKNNNIIIENLLIILSVKVYYIEMSMIHQMM